MRSRPDQLARLGQLPIGAELIVEVLPESRIDGLIVLSYAGADMATFYLGRYSRSLYRVLREAQRSGYRVWARARRIEPGRRSDEDDGNPNPLDSYLEVRSVLPADLRYWLMHTREQREGGFFELWWIKTSRYNDQEDSYQLARRMVLGDQHSLICQCEFRPLPGLGGKPDAAEVFVNGGLIGEIREATMEGASEVVAQVNDGCRWGMARVRRWHDGISLEVCPVNTAGRLPHWPGPFLWRDERRAARGLRNRDS